MENQHKMISGYRELSKEEIDTMNSIKAQGLELRTMINKLKASNNYDKRWVSIAETHLQQGIMAAVRSVAKPDGF